MNRAPNWTDSEFEILLQSPNISNESLQLKLPGQTVDAIQIVRFAIHAYHKYKTSSKLSKMMISRLDKSGGGLVCPICKIPIL